jgi:hypothetical protein
MKLAVAVCALALAAAQMVPVQRTNPPVVTEVDAPAAVMSILRRACYDCHSNETRWPWYSRVAPTSFLVARHVKKGRGELNFSEWPILDFEGQSLEFGDIRDVVSQGKMPLRSYTWIHGDAILSQEDRDAILEWASGGDPPHDY